MAAHHIVPRFFLARWANGRGLLEVVDRRVSTVSEQDPATFVALPEFNRIEAADGGADPWLEHEFLGSMDSDVADLMPQLENVPGPSSLRKLKRARNWHPTHFASPRATVRLAMHIAAQAVRSPTWRDAAQADTAGHMRRHVEASVRAQLAAATDRGEIAELERRLGCGIRCRFREPAASHVRAPGVPAWSSPV